MPWSVNHQFQDWLRCPTCGAQIEMMRHDKTLLSGNVAHLWSANMIRCPEGHPIPTLEALRKAHFGDDEPDELPLGQYGPTADYGDETPRRD